MECRMKAARVLSLDAAAGFLTGSTEVYRWTPLSRLKQATRGAIPATGLSALPSAPAARTSVFDSAFDAVLLRTMNGAIAYWNRAAEETYGWTADEAAGR